MTDEKGFTVRDRRRVKPNGAAADTEGEQEQEAKKERSATRPSGADAKPKNPPLPPVDFTGFVLGLAQMGLVHLGEIPEPVSGTVQQDLEQARHTIDILDMLGEKTQGNLNEHEGELLQNLRSELKLKYVQLIR